ncbi:hypothetical protein [Paenibacillus gorillae]|uniref:hypothetical protein n=1 Tax=Paenibacillus gorillae TaxID=1243662 RepID=UPI0004B79212|nr:hypothetical protein [Paenibacillus gorillae]
MNFSLNWKKEGRKWLAAALASVLILTSLAGTANAAEDTVTDIQFKYDAADYNSGSSALEVFVEDDKVEVLLYATLSNSSTQRDVTSEATWKSSNTSYVKVEKGVLTGVGKGTATISATYKGNTISIRAISDFVYNDVNILESDKDAGATKDIELGQRLSFDLAGTKGNKTDTITDEATWTSSSTTVATVNKGEITLVGTGTTTITAKYKGKSDSIKLNVTSPYKSITIEPKGSIELNIGEDDAKLTATALSKLGTTEAVTTSAEWSSSNTKVATVKEGVVTAVGTGTATITVSHKGVKDTIQVVVRTAIQAIKLTPEKELHLQLQNGIVELKAEILDNSSVLKNITLDEDAVWTTSNPVAATVSQGKVEPRAVGSTKITVTYKGLSRSIDVTVYPSISALSVEKEELDGFVDSNEALPKVFATTFNGDKVDVSKLVNWTTADSKIVEIEDGKWKAKALGKVVMTATAQGFKAEVTLTVHVKPLKLIANEKEVSAIIGKELPLPGVTVVNEDGEEEDISKKITWKTSSDNIVLKAETMKGLEASSVTLTGTYLNKSVTVRVKIEEEIVKIVVEPGTVELYPGGSKTIKVTGYYKSGKTVSLNSKMNWESASEKIASVKSTSSVRAVDIGTTKLTGSYQGKAAEVKVIVSPKLKSLALSDKAVKLSAGQSFTVKLTANYTTGSPVDATAGAVWTSSKSSVATVVNGRITAVGKGSASIKATYAGKTVTVRVTVK